MQIADAQRDMARAHVCGAPGVFVSGLVWLIAGGLWERYGVETGFIALFVGGVLIFPASTSPMPFGETLSAPSAAVLSGESSAAAANRP